jgi:hypothetical protein
MRGGTSRDGRPAVSFDSRQQEDLRFVDRKGLAPFIVDATIFTSDAGGGVYNHTIEVDQRKYFGSTNPMLEMRCPRMPDSFLTKTENYKSNELATMDRSLGGSRAGRVLGLLVVCWSGYLP